VYTGEVQQWRDGRWRTVVTAAGTPVDDRRRRREDQIVDDLRAAFTVRRPEDLRRGHW
jgi:ribosomal protein L13E